MTRNVNDVLGWDFYKVSYSGIVSPNGLNKGNVEQLVKFNGVYTISSAVLARLRNAELAVYGKGKSEGLNMFLLTLTFPIEWDNLTRINKNIRFKDLARKTFPDGGMWFTEVHTGKDYKNRKGILVNGNPEMIGKFHFHYKILTPKTKGQVLSWLRDQQVIDKVRNNSYDISQRSDELSIYAAAYAAKKEQKAYVMYNHRPWASWGLDKNPVTVSAKQLEQNFTMRLVNDNKNMVVTGNEYPIKVYKQKQKNDCKLFRHGDF